MAHDSLVVSLAFVHHHSAEALHLAAARVNLHHFDRHLYGLFPGYDLAIHVPHPGNILQLLAGGLDGSELERNPVALPEGTLLASEVTTKRDVGDCVHYSSSLEVQG